MHKLSKKRKFFSSISYQLIKQISKYKGIGPTILLYHSVHTKKDKQSVSDDWSISKDEFEKHLRYISKHCIPVPVETISQCLRENEKLNPKWISITFDDGFRNVINNALPLLKKYEIPWTFCIPSHCIEECRIPWQTEMSIINSLITNKKIKNDIIHIVESNVKVKVVEIEDDIKSLLRNQIKPEKRYEIIETIKKYLSENNINYKNHFYEMVNWQQLVDIKNDDSVDVSFAVHGGLHVPLQNNMSKDQMFFEIYQSKQLLEKMLGQCKNYSLVGGIYVKESLDILIQAGYENMLVSGESNNIINENNVIINENLVILPRIIGEYSIKDIQLEIFNSKYYNQNIN